MGRQVYRQTCPSSLNLRKGLVIPDSNAGLLFIATKVPATNIKWDKHLCGHGGRAAVSLPAALKPDLGHCRELCGTQQLAPGDAQPRGFPGERRGGGMSEFSPPRSKNVGKGKLLHRSKKDCNEAYGACAGQPAGTDQTEDGDNKRLTNQDPRQHSRRRDASPLQEFRN